MSTTCTSGRGRSCRSPLCIVRDPSDGILQCQSSFLSCSATLSVCHLPGRARLSCFSSLGSRLFGRLQSSQPSLDRVHARNGWSQLGHSEQRQTTGGNRCYKSAIRLGRRNPEATSPKTVGGSPWSERSQRYIHESSLLISQAILEILLRGEKLEDDVDLEKLSHDTEGFSGSDLKRG